MLRDKAVRAMLIEDVAALRLPERAGADEEERLADEDERRADEVEALAGARRRALGMVVLDAVALGVLFLLRDGEGAFLPMDGGVDTVFTLGVLAVAAHLGNRWARYRSLTTVERLHGELG